ncbi:MAG: small lipoprotein [Leptospira sp.]|nr:small lipoprotein [Leptospira sp.]
MTTKFNIFIILLIVLVNCADIYSPFGVKGKDAKKEIGDLNTNLTILTSTTLISSDASRNNFKCQTDPTAVVGSTNINPAANFTIPSDANTTDLDSRSGGIRYFRSNASSQATSVVIQSIPTETTNSTVSCTYAISPVACSGAINTSVSVSSSGLSTFVTAGSCIAITCTSAAYIRILPANVSGINAPTSSNPFQFFIFSFRFLASSIFNDISGIKDDTYYTEESFKKCKNSVTELSLLSSSISVNSLLPFRDALFCNKPVTSFPIQVNPFLESALKGNECKLEEVNLIGF